MESLDKERPIEPDETLDDPEEINDEVADRHTVESRVEEHATIEALHHFLDTRVTPTERQVLWLHFGFEDGKEYNPSEIACQLGITPESARAIIKAALKQLRDPNITYRL